jgi:hypothetical protein
MYLHSMASTENQMIKLNKKNSLVLERNYKLDLARVTWVLSIDEKERREEVNIHRLIHTVPQLLHIFPAKILKK